MVLNIACVGLWCSVILKILTCTRYKLTRKCYSFGNIPRYSSHTEICVRTDSDRNEAQTLIILYRDLHPTIANRDNYLWI